MIPKAFMQEFIANLQKELKPRGRKAELARYLTGGDPARFASYSVTISRALNGTHNDIAGSLVLAIQEFLKHPSPKPSCIKKHGRAKPGG